MSHGQSDLVRVLLNSIDKHLVFRKKIEVCITYNIHEKIIEEKFNNFSISTIKNVRPKGFADNHNSVFNFFDPDLFFIINPDIEFFSRFDLNDFVKKIPRFGLASPVILDHNFNLEDFVRTNLTPISILKRRIQKNTNIKKFDWVAGMFLAFNKQSFISVQGFDPRYFLYVEDCDISNMVTKKGGLLKVIESHKVIHRAQRKSNRSAKYFFIHLKSLLYYWQKKILGIL